MAFESPSELGSGGYRIPPHHRGAKSRRTHWGLWTASLSGVAGVVALLTLSSGIGGATPDVPTALQVGSQASTTSTPPVAHVAPTTTAPTTSVPGASTTPSTPPPTTVAPTTTAPPTTVAPTTSLPRTSTTLSTVPPTSPVTIVIPKSKVTEGTGGSDDSSNSSRSTTKQTDN